MWHKVWSFVVVVCCCLLSPPVGQAADVAINLVSGWNLINLPVQPGNATITAVLGSALTTTTSVWKWGGASWAVYLPGESDGGKAYASSKGFSALATLNAGEGAWLNRQQPGQLLVNGQYPTDAGVSLAKGWNLVGLKGPEPVTVAEISVGQGLAMVSVWKWTGTTWAVSLPGEKDKGQQYAIAKNFVLLTLINPHEGFWVNVAALAGTTTTTTAVPSTTSTTEPTSTTTTAVPSTTSTITTTTAPPTTTTTSTSTPSTTTTVAPKSAEGKVFAKIGSNLVPVQSAKVYLDEDKTQELTESDYTGLFHYATTQEQTVTIAAPGFYDVTGPLAPGAARNHFLLVPTLEVVDEEGGNNTELGKVAGKVDTFKSYPNLFIMEAQDTTAAKATSKVVADDHAAITITEMTLEKDITVAVDTFSTTAEIVDAGGVNLLLGAGQNSAVIGGANVLVTAAQAGPTTSQAAGFGGNVRAKLADFNLSSGAKTLAAMQADIANGSGMVYLFAYAPQEESAVPAWQLVGEGEIVKKGGAYEVSTATGVVMDGLYPFLFLYGSKKAITGTVVSGGQPVANALIKLQNSGVTTVSGADGAFVLGIPDILTKGAIRVYHEQYYRLSKTLLLPKGSASVQDIGPVSLIPVSKFNLQGVLSDHHGKPLVGAQVRLTFVAVPPHVIFPQSIQATTDATGFYQFPGVPQELKSGATVEVTTSNGFRVVLDQGWPPATAGVVTLDATLVTPLWVHKTGGNLYAAPVVAGESLYVGGVDHLMRSLDTATGDKHWAYDAGRPIFATPALDADNLYFPTLNNQLVALNQQTGTALWSDTKVNFFGGSNNYDIITTPVLNNGVLSFGSNDNYLYLYNTDGSQMISEWLTSNITGSSALADNTIFFGAWDGYFYAYPASGDVLAWKYKWRYPAAGEPPLPARILSSPLAANGKLYFGGGNNLTVTLVNDDKTVTNYPPFNTDGLHQTVVFSENVVGSTITVDLEDKHLYCLNAVDGTLAWSRDLDGAVVGRPALNGSSLIVATLHGTVAAFDLATAPTTPPTWTFSAQDAVYSSPVVSGGRVYFGSSDHSFYCLDAATGKQLWRMKTGGEIIAAPVVADGRIFIASLDGTLYCVEE
jgi:outer membrane protein assembly factor BamB